MHFKVVDISILDAKQLSMRIINKIQHLFTVIFFLEIKFVHSEMLKS